MTKNLVSIIVAVYNAEGLISRCLDSLLSQTYRDIEVIVINDASTDGTQKVLDDYARKDSRIILLQMEKNSGAPAARNKGMESSRGEFLTMVDADDTIAPDAIELSVKDLRKDDDIDMVTFYMIKVDSRTGKQTPLDPNPAVPQLMTGEDACYWSLQYDFTPNGVSRSPLEQSMPAKAEYGQHSDETVTHLVLLKARKVKLGEGRYYYYQMPESVTHNVSIKRFDILESRILLKQQLLDQHLGTKAIRRLDVKRWREFFDMCHFYWQHKAEFTVTEQHEIEERLSKTYDTFHFSDLPLRTVLKPRFLMLPTFKLFYLQLSIVFRLHLIHISNRSKLIL